MMNWQDSIPTYSTTYRGQVIWLEAPSSQSRQARIQQWLDAATEQYGTKTWFLDSDRNMGIWAGIDRLLIDLIPQIQARAPHLITQHDYELIHVLPTLRRTLPIRYLTLTDVPPPNEHLTYYPADRVVQILHGIIDLLSDWHQISPEERWIIACDRYDRSTTLVRRFFVELMRRRGDRLNLTLLVATDSGASETLAGEFAGKNLVNYVKLNLAGELTSVPSQQQMATSARDLAARIGSDDLEKETYLPRLIYYWLSSDTPQKALSYQIEACSIYAIRGFYHEAIAYGEAALAQLERYCPENTDKRWGVSERLHDCYLSMRQPLRAFELLEQAIAKTDCPNHLFRAYGKMATLHSRYLPKRDLTLAETYIERSYQELEKASLSDDARFYQKALNQRGVALIRHVQGNFAEAVKICLSTYEKTQQERPHKHLPHQALLLFNLSRVYVSTGPQDLAISYLSSAIALDPNYSEYYNHRGNTYMKMGHFSNALNDYLKAIELSPPYAEVWTNVGQCYRMMDRMEEAVEAYTTSLDLEPDRELALIGRAQAFETLGRLEAALDDYDRAIELNSDNPLILANRAILHYEIGNTSEALADLDRAITLAPENPDLYQNRAVALTAMGRHNDVIRDLQTYLQLNPNAEDCEDVKSQLSAIQITVT
jgi:tetratricopeptide (TPR) repeat protein